jgi:hypothetical protein
VSIRFLLKAASHAKERGIEAIKVQLYPGLRGAHNEQIFNHHKAVLDAMGDQAAISARTAPARSPSSCTTAPAL